jgi:FtsZ-binding cell division protein ZapB
MSLHILYIKAVLTEMRQYLEKNFITFGDAPKAMADEVKKIADHVKKSTDAMHLRQYLLDYIGLTSSFWRIFAAYTHHNKLLSHLESVVNSPEFSPQSIHLAQITHVHEHYLVKQKELIEPLQIEIQTLRSTCDKLQTTVTSLREENNRLRIENDFFMSEIVTIQGKFINAASTATLKDSPPKIESASNPLISAPPIIECKMLTTL